MPALAASEIERFFREEYGRAVAVLVRHFGDIDVAEEAVQDAFAVAVQRWPSTGLPASPAGWIIVTARNRAIDRLRREASRQDRHAQAALLHARDEPAEEGPVRDDRLRAVLAVVYLIFNEGHTASSGDRLVREDLSTEAVRLGRLLAELMPDEPKVMGLLALMLLVESRRSARTSPHGDLVLLADQDRGLWDRDLVAEGQAIVRRCLRLGRPGPYQIQAAINAVHSDAPAMADTDWWQIVQLYDQLLALAPSPVVALNRAVAVAEVEGPEAALRLVNGLELGGYYLFHAVRAELLRRLGRTAEAAQAYEAAIARTENAAERAFLQRSRQTLARA